VLAAGAFGGLGGRRIDQQIQASKSLPPPPPGNTFSIIYIVGAKGGLFLYSPTAGPDNLVYSIAAQAGIDKYGNPYPPGAASWSASGIIVMDAGTISLEPTGFFTAGSIFSLVPGQLEFVSPTTAAGDTAAEMTLISASEAPTGQPQMTLSGVLELIQAAGVPAEVAGNAVAYSNSAGDLGVVSGGDGQAYDTQTVTRITAGQTVSSTVPAAVTWGKGANPLVQAGIEYHVHGEMVCTMGGVTAAAVFQFTGPAVTAMRVKYFAIENVSILASNQITAIASAMNSGAIPNGTAGQFFFDGIIEFSAGGSLGLEVAQGTAGDNWTLNSQCEMWVRPVVA
jgi:hypothetical protein